MCQLHGGIPVGRAALGSAVTWPWLSSREAFITGSLDSSLACVYCCSCEMSKPQPCKSLYKSHGQYYWLINCCCMANHWGMFHVWHGVLSAFTQLPHTRYCGTIPCHTCVTLWPRQAVIEHHGKERKEIYAYYKSKIVLFSFGFVFKKTQSRYFIDVGWNQETEIDNFVRGTWFSS